LNALRFRFGLWNNCINHREIASRAYRRCCLRSRNLRERAETRTRNNLAGTAWNVALGNYPDAHAELLATSDKLEPVDVLRTVPLKVLGVTVHHFDGYQKALDALETMGFREAAGTLIPFAYDWRRDVRQSAEALKERLADGDLAGRSVALVAHSMGGLLARYMLEKLRPPGAPPAKVAFHLSV
jgi:hypothetical protein